MSTVSRRNVLTQAMASIGAMALGPLRVSLLSAQTIPPKEHHIAIHGFKFTPDRVSVKPGDMIVWTNQDIAPHTATARDNSWDTGTITIGKSKKILVTQDFSSDYFCRFHPQMQAKLKLVS